MMTTDIQIPSQKDMITYLMQWADNSLILGHRLGEWCGHGPVLEQDIALTNIALDLIGESRNIYQYAASIEGNKDENYYPYHRKEREFVNCKLVELPNVDFAYTIVRQFLYDSFHYYFLKAMMKSDDETMSAIAQKSFKESSYHLDFSSDWMKRLGDGTEESHIRIQKACDDYWEYGEEVFLATTADEVMESNAFGVSLDKIKHSALNHRKRVMDEAQLRIPDVKYFQSGGKKGIHTEHLGFILTDMQYLTRTYPGAKW
jgi:ring-1,2-phenylacetyl-CoA epoxidase subunit PaaC